MFRFPKKMPVEKLVLAYSFAADLAAGEQLSGAPTVTYTTLYGTDINPGALANGTAAIDATGTTVLIPVQGGLDQCDYLIVVACNTTNPLKLLAWPAVLPVAADPETP